MKKSNNKRTKRLRLKYKKTKKNVKRRTLRKTRHRQSGGLGLPTTTILPSTVSVGQLIVRKVLSSMRDGTINTLRRAGKETMQAVESTFNPKTVNEFTIGHHAAAPIPVRRNILEELIETIKAKAKGKLVKKNLENCLFGESETSELAPEGVRYARLYSTKRADESAKALEKPSQYPNISSANLKLLQKEMHITNEDLLHNDEEVKEKINEFVDTIIAQETSQCTLKKKKSASPVLSPGNVDMPPHVRIKSARSRQHLLEEEASAKRTLNF
jgi:hypothetical protein